MSNQVCTCPSHQDRPTRSRGVCLMCGAKSNLESWSQFLEDFRRKNPHADLDDILMERLNLKWLCEGKPVTWDETNIVPRVR